MRHFLCLGLLAVTGCYGPSRGAPDGYIEEKAYLELSDRYDELQAKLEEDKAGLAEVEQLRRKNDELRTALEGAEDNLDRLRKMVDGYEKQLNIVETENMPEVDPAETPTLDVVTVADEVQYEGDAIEVVECEVRYLGDNEFTWKLRVRNTSATGTASATVRCKLVDAEGFELDDASLLPENLAPGQELTLRGTFFVDPDLLARIDRATLEVRSLVAE